MSDYNQKQNNLQRNTINGFLPGCSWIKLRKRHNTFPNKDSNSRLYPDDGQGKSLMLVVTAWIVYYDDWIRIRALYQKVSGSIQSGVMFPVTPHPTLSFRGRTPERGCIIGEGWSAIHNPKVVMLFSLSCFTKGHTISFYEKIKFAMFMKCLLV